MKKTRSQTKRNEKKNIREIVGVFYSIFMDLRVEIPFAGDFFGP